MIASNVMPRSIGSTVQGGRGVHSKSGEQTDGHIQVTIDEEGSHDR